MSLVKEERALMNVVELTCPGCGERLTLDMKICPSCHGPVTITSFGSLSSMSPIELNKYASAYRRALSEHPDDQRLNFSAAMCYLKLGVYEKAMPAFEKAIEDNFDDAEAYFYAAVCLFHGKKAFLQPRPVIDRALEYLSAAAMIEPKGIYYYFSAYIKYDYFARKGCLTSPDFRELLALAHEAGVSESDAALLFELLHTERPDCL